MKDYVVFICIKDTLTVLRREYYNAWTLEAVQKDVSYLPDREDIYIYEVTVGPLVLKTGPYG